MIALKPSGNPLAEVYVVGEHPSLEDIKSGSNFQGGEGNIIRGALKKAGFNPESDIRYGNVSYYGDKSVYNIDELLSDINRYPRKVIIPVGDKALSVLTDKEHILKWRGSVLSSYNFDCPVLPTISAGFIRKNNWAHILTLRSDCKKAYRVWKNNYVLPKREMMCVTKGATYIDFAIEFERLANLKGGLIAYDIEGLYPRMVAISFSDDPSKGVTVPLNWRGFTEEQKLSLYGMINKILTNESTGKVAHNMLYDNPVMSRYGIGMKGIFMDTMLAHKALYPGGKSSKKNEDKFEESGAAQTLPHSLAYLMSIYSWEPYYKDDRILSELVGEVDKADEYSIKDSCVTLEVVEPLIRELASRDLTDFFFNHEMTKVWASTYQACNGLPILEDIRSQLKMETLSTIEELEKPLEGIVDASSSQDSCRFLYGEKYVDKVLAKVKKSKVYLHGNELNLKEIERKRKLPSGKVIKTTTSDDDAIRELVGKYPEHKEILLQMLEIRKRKHDVSTYLEAIDVNGVFYYAINISGTMSGRNSCGLTLDDKGIAAQGIPSGKSPGSQNLRRMIGKDGLLVWEVDASQAEARDVGWRAEEEWLINDFINKKDIHKKSAALLFDLKMEEVTKEMRQLGKIIKHSTSYWIGPNKLVDVVREHFPAFPFDVKMAKYFISKLRVLYPKTYEWGCNIRDAVNAGQREWRSAYGRRLFLFGPINDELVRTAISFQPQADIGDHTTLAHPRVLKRFLESDMDPTKNKVINLVQDSIVGLAEEKNVSTIMTIVKEEMEKPIPGLYYKGIPLVIPAEFAVGPNWGEMKEIKS